MIAKGQSPEKIIIVDVSEGALREAADRGFIGLRGNATHETIIRKTNVEKAKAVIVSPGRDDTNVLIVLTVRNLNPDIKIISSAKEAENIKLIKQSGADVIVSPAKLGGYLLADAVIRPHTVSYLVDLMTARGRISLTERLARPEEIGLSMDEIKPDLVVRLHRDGKPIGFWEKENNTIQDGDVLVIIEATGSTDFRTLDEEKAVVE
jgi:voltage-gated potassium channel